MDIRISAVNFNKQNRTAEVKNRNTFIPQSGAINSDTVSFTSTPTVKIISAAEALTMPEAKLIEALPAMFEHWTQGLSQSGAQRNISMAVGTLGTEIISTKLHLNGGSKDFAFGIFQGHDAENLISCVRGIYQVADASKPTFTVQDAFMRNRKVNTFYGSHEIGKGISMLYGQFNDKGEPSRAMALVNGVWQPVEMTSKIRAQLSKVNKEQYAEFMTSLLPS